MENKLIAIIIVVGLVLSGTSYYLGTLDRSAKTQQFINSSSVPKSNFLELLKSEMIEISATTSGTFKEMSGKNIILTRISEQGESEVLSVPIKEGSQVIAEYILPASASSGEIIGTIVSETGRITNLGAKVASLQEIKEGDNVSIALDLNQDGTYLGILIRISPAELFETKKWFLT